MARPLDPRIRARLRNEAIEYVLSHGINDHLALRPLAKALNTNARMLVYHFGSREGLMREILAGLREVGDARIREWFGQSGPSHTLADFLHWYWKQMTAPEARSIIKIIFELYALALRRPKDYPGVLEDPVAYWGKLTRKTRESKFEEAVATLLLAATRGLLLDLCATGDRERTEEALNLLARLVESEGTVKKASHRTAKRRSSHHVGNKKHQE
jgi:AcrR family transcriptional regulator